MFANYTAASEHTGKDSHPFLTIAAPSAAMGQDKR